jgi:uncharacterized membrane protein YkgB
MTQIGESHNAEVAALLSSLLALYTAISTLGFYLIEPGPQMHQSSIHCSVSMRLA